MVKTRIEGADTCDDLSGLAAKLIDQFNGLPMQQTEVAHFFKGIVVRTGVHLKDAALLLHTNHDQHLFSAFVLFRILLDDLLRSCYVFASTDRQEAVNTLTAKAYNDWYKTWREAGRLNQSLQLGDAMTEALTERERDKFLSDAANDAYVLTNGQGKRAFKKGVPTDQMVRIIEKCPRVAAYSRGYVLFKQMSHYVHFSMLPYKLDRESDLRALEIRFIDEIMFLTYQLLRVSHEVIATENSQLTWPESPVDTSFNRKNYIETTGTN
ncbi:MAG: hypothetical protein ACOH13_07245 [Flavobacteriales bacterium]